MLRQSIEWDGSRKMCWNFQLLAVMDREVRTGYVKEIKNRTWRSSRTRHSRLLATFFEVLYLLLTLEDDLFGTRATDNQVKTLRSRQDDRHGQSADAIADALSRIIFGLRFWRRRETQIDSVKTLLTYLFDGKVEEARNSCVVTADRGYGK